MIDSEFLLVEIFGADVRTDIIGTRGPKQLLWVYSRQL